MATRTPKLHLTFHHIGSTSRETVLREGAEPLREGAGPLREGEKSWEVLPAGHVTSHVTRHVTSRKRGSA